MSNKDAFAERERGLEEEYFMRKERELVEKMRAKQADENALKAMAEATGLQDQEVIEALQELGYTPETITLLHLVPLIQVAWANGDIAANERELIVKAAQSRGVAMDSAAEKQLNEWLEKKPAQGFFDASLRAIRIFITALPTNQRADARQDLLTYCRNIAQAAGGFLGLGAVSDDEQAALAAISEALAKLNPTAAQEVIAE